MIVIKSIRKIKIKPFNIIGIVIILAIIGVFIWQFKLNDSLYTIRASDVWKPSDDSIIKWHECKDLYCNLDLMSKTGASLGARKFVRLFFPERGFLREFKELGKVDLGTVAFPDRANENEEYHLLNGIPITFDTYISDEDLIINEIRKISAVEEDPLYPEMKEKFPKIELWGTAQEFIEKKIDGNNEEFIFRYKFVDDCRICITEYTARIAFLFDSNGEYLRTKFLQIDNVIDINNTSIEGEKLEFDLNNDDKKEIIFQRNINAANGVQLIIADDSGKVLYSTLMRAGTIEIKDNSVYHTSSLQDQLTVTKIYWDGNNWKSENAK